VKGNIHPRVHPNIKSAAAKSSKVWDVGIPSEINDQKGKTNCQGTRDFSSFKSVDGALDTTKELKELSPHDLHQLSSKLCNEEAIAKCDSNLTDSSFEMRTEAFSHRTKVKSSSKKRKDMNCIDTKRKKQNLRAMVDVTTAKSKFSSESSRQSNSKMNFCGTINAEATSSTYRIDSHKSNDTIETYSNQNPNNTRDFFDDLEM
jgi:hypothetical protein